MKWIFDFDGVLTEQTEEAHRVREIFTDALAQWTGSSRSEVDRHIASIEEQMDRNPSHYGWEVHGRISAYCNEDLFIRGNALAAAWDRQPPSSGWVQKLQDRGYPDFKSFGQWAYGEMVRETQAGKLKPMDPQTREVLESLLSRGDQVVIVSNSGTERILNLFEGLGLQAIAHDQDPRASFRVRGAAAKFMLGEAPRSFTVGDYKIDTDRPLYEKILREEKPDAVVGDVFSLDLALPGYLAQADLSLPSVTLYLRAQHYTPSWSKMHCTAGGAGNVRARTCVLRALPELLSPIGFKGV